MVHLGLFFVGVPVVIGVGRVGRCGIASTEGNAAQDLAFLAQFGNVNQVNSMAYGGPTDPCTLNIQNDANWMSKNPSNCNTGVLFLWDEPYTQSERGHPEWCSASFQASQWAAYANQWSSELRQKRQSGMMVTTPLFTQGNVAVDVKVDEFFTACPACSDPGSPAYIDVIGINAWVGAFNDGIPAGGQWIKNMAAKLKQNHGNRQVWLGNFGYIGGDATGQKELDAMWQSGVYDSNSGIDSIYFFVAVDYGGNIPIGVNQVDTKVGETTIGYEIMKICGLLGPSPPTPTPTPQPPSASCSAHPVCAQKALEGNCCPTNDGTMLDCCSTAFLI